MELLTAAQREVINARVHAGAALFDKRAPRDWAQTVNQYRDELDVSDPYKCPLAVLYGSYLQGLSVMGMDTDHTREEELSVARLGFTLVGGDPELDVTDGQDGDAWTDEAFAAMTDAWLREAAERVALAAH